ncbi:MAG: flavodoxin family protein [candidate division Zixibacteria bacterium]|nr:flavodoxin family protein [candidate division Zixibacteria bacterium]
MKLLIVNGSPRQGSSTEILADQFRRGFETIIPDSVVVTIRLNDLEIVPCQSCGINPTPLPCIYKDQLYPYLLHLLEADMILIASPIYFDSISAQTKLFIDRTNCLRPPIFAGNQMSFAEPRASSCKGAYILIAGQRQKFDLAERVIGGMFVWGGIAKIGKLVYAHSHSGLGAAASDETILAEAYDLGVSTAKIVQKDRA